jgi:hypothetical protein
LQLKAEVLSKGGRDESVWHSLRSKAAGKLGDKELYMLGTKRRKEIEERLSTDHCISQVMSLVSQAGGAPKAAAAPWMAAIAIVGQGAAGAPPEGWQEALSRAGGDVLKSLGGVEVAKGSNLTDAMGFLKGVEYSQSRGAGEECGLVHEWAEIMIDMASIGGDQEA